MATMLASSSVAAHVSCARVSRSNFTGNALRLSAPQRQVQVLRRAAVAEEAAPATFTPPKLDPSWPSPIFGGSTGGLLRKAQVGGLEARKQTLVVWWEGTRMLYGAVKLVSAVSSAYRVARE